MTKQQLEHYKDLFGLLAYGAVILAVVFILIALYFQYQQFK